MNKKNIKTWIIGAILIVAVGYFMYSGGSGTTSSDTLLSAESSNEIVGAQVLNLLNQIQSLNVDTALFKSAAYASLKDYTIAIPRENVGRPNPFAPLPGVRSNTASR